MTTMDPKNQHLKHTIRVIEYNQGELLPDQKPIVLKYKKLKKKDKDGKPRYSSALKDIQLLQGDAVQVAQTTARAFSKSINTYDQERRRSAKNKRDGAIQDFFQNSAKATSTFLKESSDIPVDLSKSMKRIAKRNNFTKNLRRVSRRIGTWPI